MTTTEPWERFEHGADVGVRGRGATLDEAFANAAIALTSVIVEPREVERHGSIEFDCTADDVESLFLEFMNAVVYQMAVKRMLFSKFIVKITGGALHAHAIGETVNVRRHQPAVEVKAATYHALSVRRGDDGMWTAQCVVDV